MVDFLKLMIIGFDEYHLCPLNYVTILLPLGNISWSMPVLSQMMNSRFS